MNAEKTGKLIREARTAKGLTQQALATALNMSTTAVSKWENGHSLPDIALLEKLSSVLDLSVTEIVVGERNEKKMDLKNNERAIKSVITEAVKQKRKGVIKWVSITLAIVSVLAVAFINFILVGFPVKQEDVVTRTEIVTEKNGDKQWLIHFETKDGKPLVAKTKYGFSDNTKGSAKINRVVITLKSPPLGGKNQTEYTYGYSAEKDTADNFDFTVEVKYKNAALSYSMEKEGLFNN